MKYILNQPPHVRIPIQLCFVSQIEPRPSQSVTLPDFVNPFKIGVVTWKSLCAPSVERVPSISLQMLGHHTPQPQGVVLPETYIAFANHLDLILPICEKLFPHLQLPVLLNLSPPIMQV
ncbi:hypothetical protein KC19_VG159800 [Ceratodon purpureus]|uniref:Uncharacterized protein n=1 Tax=Ceratodon purpureus TaxID=3225 RepID=A0A8T0HQV2_CERPU|nr:hypothetical protein KC19_VG159800 [Ceratodon purpureus]